VARSQGRETFLGEWEIDWALVEVDFGKIYRGQTEFDWELWLEIESQDRSSVSGMRALLRLCLEVVS
jgi:hypothetical protein